LKLDDRAAKYAFDEYASQFGLSREAASEGVLSIANSKMADAIRQLTVQRGIDPREFSILAFGGAGPMHALSVAEELEIPRVIIPALPGVFSAWGMLFSDIKHNAVETIFEELTETIIPKLESGLKALRKQLEYTLKEERISLDGANFSASFDMRYKGQEHYIDIAIPDEELCKKALEKYFHERYNTLYGHSTPEEAIEVVNIRLNVEVRVNKSDVEVFTERAVGAPLPIKTINSIFRNQSYETSIYVRKTLRYGHEFDGPAIVTELTTTSVIPPGWNVEVDNRGYLIANWKG
jgi:N-methylhydantoinase A